MLHQRRVPFLSSVVEMQNALSALADTAPIRFCEQFRRALCQGGKQVFRLLWLEPWVQSEDVPGRLQPATHGMRRHQSIYLSRSNLGQSKRNCLADATRAPGNQSHAVLQVRHAEFRSSAAANSQRDT